MLTIATNIAHIHQRINSACQRVGRDPQTVRLVAVSKIKPAKDIEKAYQAGQMIFGESYVQEFRDKSPLVKVPVQWHFIGGLQSNKVKYLRGKVEMIHSVDRLSLAQEIDHQWAKIHCIADVLLQVNVGDEASKSGCSVAEIEQLTRQVAALPNLKICGLMCLPPQCDDAEEVRPFFKKLRELSEYLATLQLANVFMNELSMGMSDDFEVAVEEGATLVRIGTAIFGARIKND